MQIVVESLETKRHDYNNLLSSHSLSSDDILFIVHDDLLVITDIIDNVKNIYLGCTPAFQVNYNREVAMLCLQVRKAGEVLQEIGYIYQERSVDHTCHGTVQEIISLVNAEKSNRKQNISSAIVTVKVENLKNNRIGKSPDGQQQRVFKKKALINDFWSSIPDEIAITIGVETQNKVHSLKSNPNEEFCVTILCPCHDLTMINKLSKRQVYITRTRFYRSNPPHFFSRSGLPRMNSKPIIHVHVPYACQNIDFNDNDWKTYVH